MDLQGVFYHQNRTIIVYNDVIFAAHEKLSSIYNFTLHFYFNACSKWTDYNYLSDNTLLKEKLNFVLLYIHLFIETFVFQDKLFNVYYTKGNDLEHALKAEFAATFLVYTHERSLFFGLSFFHKDKKVKVFQHEKRKKF